jgi:hypothetical protein
MDDAERIAASIVANKATVGGRASRPRRLDA